MSLLYQPKMWRMMRSPPLLTARSRVGCGMGCGMGCGVCRNVVRSRCMWHVGVAFRHAPPRGGSPWRSLRRVGFTAPHRVVRMSLSRTLPTCPRQSLPSPYPPRDPTTSGRSKRTNLPFNCCSVSVRLVVRPMPTLVVGLYDLTPLNQNFEKK